MSSLHDAPDRVAPEPSPVSVIPKTISQGFKSLRRFNSPFLKRVPVPQYVTLVIGVVILIVAFITLIGSFSAR